MRKMFSILFLSVFILTACGKSDLAADVASTELSTEYDQADIDKIIDLTNNYLLDKASADTTSNELVKLYIKMEDAGYEINEDMTMLNAYISTDSKDNRKKIMAYRNRIANWKEDLP